MAETAGQAADGVVVSVVTVCFNSERYIGEAIQSVLAQSYADVEYIIIDGGSTDSTLDIIREYELRFTGRLRWVSEPDRGIYDAMNKGIAMCQGELIGLLNSDDRYLPDAIAEVVDAYESASGVGAVYGDAEIIDECGAHVRWEPARRLRQGETRPDWMPMCHQSLFVARRTYMDIGVYDTDFRVLADYEFILRCLARGVVILHVAEPIAQFRLGGVCNSDIAQSAVERERIRVAYGANRVVERARRLRHAVNRAAYALVGGARGSVHGGPSGAAPCSGSDLKEGKHS